METDKLPYGLDYYTYLAYTREVKMLSVRLLFIVYLSSVCLPSVVCLSSVSIFIGQIISETTGWNVVKFYMYIEWQK